AGGSGAVNVANTGFTATANWMASSCAVDPSHKANQVILFTPNGSHQTIPSNGGYWGGGFNLGIGRNNPQMDDAWADDYSKTSVCSGGLTEDSHFALYYDGTLLLEWSENAVQDTQSGAEPCCGGTVHASMISKQDIVLGGPTQTPTTAVGTDAWSVTAAPNMTDGRQPVQFQVRLDRPEKITLKLYTLLGEKICEDQVMGTAGPNILIWRAQNEAKQSVASGIYLYAVQIEGQTGMFKSGKVLVLH
ncbi:MAG TPA: hypothetical protein VFR02_07325, partial [bacterium]|nr:hypothetical protein [bacterium]